MAKKNQIADINTSSNYSRKLISGKVTATAGIRNPDNLTMVYGLAANRIEVLRDGQNLTLTHTDVVYEMEEVTVSFVETEGFVMSEFTVNGEVHKRYFHTIGVVEMALTLNKKLKTGMAKQMAVSFFWEK